MTRHGGHGTAPGPLPSADGGLRIRQELPADYPLVYRLVREAFATSSNDGEWDYLEAVRRSPHFVPRLSLVAEQDGQLVGQIVLYRTAVATPGGPVIQLVLSPISVRPSHFRQGIARAMTDRAFAIARKLGYTAVFLCGDPALYSRLGFRPSWEFGIVHAEDLSRRAPWCMALELVPGGLGSITGTIEIV